APGRREAARLHRAFRYAAGRPRADHHPGRGSGPRRRHRGCARIAGAEAGAPDLSACDTLVRRGPPRRRKRAGARRRSGHRAIGSRRRMIRAPALLCSIALGASLWWSVAADAAPPARIKVTYELSAKGMSGDAIETLEHDGKTYSIVSEAKGRGILAAI